MSVDHVVAVAAEQDQIRVPVDVITRPRCATGPSGTSRDDVAFLADDRVVIPERLRWMDELRLAARALVARLRPQHLARVIGDRHPAMMPERTGLVAETADEFGDVDFKSGCESKQYARTRATLPTLGSTDSSPVSARN